jgi:hypothetical protein
VRDLGSQETLLTESFHSFFNGWGGVETPSIDAIAQSAKHVRLHFEPDLARYIELSSPELEQDVIVRNHHLDSRRLSNYETAVAILKQTKPVGAEIKRTAIAAIEEFDRNAIRTSRHRVADLRVAVDKYLKKTLSSAERTRVKRISKEVDELQNITDRYRSEIDKLNERYHFISTSQHLGRKMHDGVQALLRYYARYPWPVGSALAAIVIVPPIIGAVLQYQAYKKGKWPIP